MDLHQVKEHLQSHLSDGLVLVVGSGLSCAEGMPGMGDLAIQLKNEVPTLIRDQDESVWQEIVALLDAGNNLEEALLKVKVSESLEKAIVDVTHEYILSHEKGIVGDVFDRGRVLRFSTLLPHLLKPNSGIPVITTNYDRLIEIASECAGLAVDNSFSGRYVSNFYPRESRFSLCRSVNQKSKKVLLEYAKFVSVFKPHGSLDWFLVNGEPICSELFVSNEKLIITPGANKFRGGYERPFDTHRELANRAIDKGSRYLIIGYGFNDEHLQVHLERQLEKGKPAVVLTRSVSEEFREYIKDKENIWVVSSRPSIDGFQLMLGESVYEFDGYNIWDLDVFVKEVLE